MVLGATDRLSCIVSLSKFYSSGNPLFLGDSPSPVFTAVLEKSHVRHGANRRCLQSNTLEGSAARLGHIQVVKRFE